MRCRGVKWPTKVLLTPEISTSAPAKLQQPDLLPFLYRRPLPVSVSSVRGGGQLPDLGWVFTAETVAGLTVAPSLSYYGQRGSRADLRLSGWQDRRGEERGCPWRVCTGARGHHANAHTPQKLQTAVCVLHGGACHWANSKHGCHDYIQIMRLCFLKSQDCEVKLHNVKKWNEQSLFYFVNITFYLIFSSFYLSVLSIMVFDFCLTIGTFCFISETFNL